MKHDLKKTFPPKFIFHEESYLMIVLGICQSILTLKKAISLPVGKGPDIPSQFIFPLPSAGSQAHTGNTDSGVLFHLNNLQGHHPTWRGPCIPLSLKLFLGGDIRQPVVAICVLHFPSPLLTF